MTQNKTTKRALLTSALSLLLCCTMLIGTTWAWFTDSVTSAGNIIKSGTLDVEMSWANGKDDPNNTTWTDASKGAIFNWNKWEPGYVDVKHIKIENVGSLAFKYQIMIKANGELETNANGHTLADAIDVYYLENAAQIADRTALADVEPECTLAQFLAANANASANTATGKLYPVVNEDGKESEHKVTIALKMREDVGNEYQDMSIGTDFSVQLLATQWTYEEDTFDERYDELANGMPDHPEWADLKANKTVPQAASGDTVIDAAPGVKVTVPENASTDDITVTVTPTAAPANVEIADTQDSASYEVDVTGAADGTLIKVELQTLAGRTGVVVKHKGTDMAAVAADNTTDEGFYYDSTTGVVTIWTKTFSPFTVLFDKPGSLSVGTLDEFNAALADENVETILLTSDITTTSVIEVVRDVTIDGGNNTITANITSGSKRAIWIDKAGVSLTLKNLNIDGANKCERGVQINTGTAEEIMDATIVIDNCHITNMTMYAINFCSFTTADLTVKNSTIQGWAAINAYGTGNVIKVDNSVLEGINDKGYNAAGWNDFSTICLEGDTTGQTDAHSEDYKIVINNSTIKASQTTGNRQTLLGYNSGAKNSTVSFNNCTFEIGGGCYFGYDFGSVETPNALFIDGNKVDMPHSYFNLSE